MKSLLIVTGIYPPDIGGPASFVRDIARHFAANGRGVTVLTLSDRSDPSDSSDRSDKASPRVVRIKRSLFLPWRMLQVARAVRRLSRNADLVFCNALYFETALGLPPDKPLVAKVVGDQVYDRLALRKQTLAPDPLAFQAQPVSGANLWDRRLRAWALRKARAVVTPSAYFKKVVSAFVPADNVIVIPNAVRDAAIREAPKVPGQLAIACRLLPNKNVAAAIEALALLPERYTLKIAGNGAQRAELEALANSLGLSARVSFLGRLSHDDTMGLIAASEFFLLLSDYENFPHTVLEAFAAGTPVLATGVGGVPELIQDGVTGILVKNRDPGEIAAIIQSLPEENRRKMAATAKEWSGRCRPPVVFGAYADLFETVLIKKQWFDPRDYEFYPPGHWHGDDHS